MHTPPPNTTGILQKKTLWFIGVEVEQETSAPPRKKKSWIRPCALHAFGHVVYIFLYFFAFLPHNTNARSGHLQGFAVNNASLWKI